jgi:hypothetical protein
MTTNDRWGVQLTIDGREVPFPLPAPFRLTERQRELLRYMRAVDSWGATFHTGDARRFFRDATGAMRRLEAAGVVEHTAHGTWRPT